MLLWALAAAAATTSAGAEACTYSMFNEEIGPKRTREEIAADEERRRREMVRQSTRAAQRRLASGADAAGELADMLVPNIQAVYIEAGGCGAGEIDSAGSAGAGYEPLVGTAYAGREKEFYPIVSDYGPGTLGPNCNAEFRGRFADHLRRRLTRAQLEESFVFLAARRRSNVVERLMAFKGRTRSPPVGWAADAQIVAWAGRHPSGRALSATVAAFWNETAPLLAGPETSCPAAFATWRQGQAELVARIEEALARRGAKP
ncbi:MAG TPA: hypothetical protein VF605_12445 [Allosphingosinicella sp.]|jgi:hypothetical protein